ncbi:hypothetical protein RR42_s1402 [Cupriavidus basilensis]|uniref:Uncharacterized protein n=1 Tax=Cupriavidus basilensis TaxID=68895 RepID=A0A0C4YK87_9BURK|nr:hypothetical protein RR42_s1402 [Cupriavidus basilensis]
MGVDVGYDKGGVEWLDGFVNGQHEKASDELKEQLVQTLGSFFGECLRHAYGGEWKQEEDGASWYISFPKGGATFPFNKVRKNLMNGPGDSVLGLFTVIPGIFPDGP